MLSPTPLIYCPVGIKRPPCVPTGRAPVAQLPGKGPDAVTTMVNGQEHTEGGGGTIYGGSYDPSLRGTWKKARAGWWVQLLNHKPQDLIRIQRHPRVRQWATIPGVRSDHQWQVPVLLEIAEGQATSALDGIWDGERWTGGELEPLQQELLALVNGVEQAAPVDLASTVRDIAVKGLELGQHVDLDLLGVAGWLGESMCLSAVAAMAGRNLG
jgi:hypothetical protein